MTDGSRNDEGWIPASAGMTEPACAGMTNDEFSAG